MCHAKEGRPAGNARIARIAGTHLNNSLITYSLNLNRTLP